MTNMMVANEILKQLGGNRFTTMTGATNLVADENALTMKIGRNAKRITHVQVILDRGTDTYTVRFMNLRQLSMRDVATATGVHADALRSVFESNTGLLTSLGTLGGASC